jgi:hypothetical protein
MGEGAGVDVVSKPLKLRGSLKHLPKPQIRKSSIA